MNQKLVFKYSILDMVSNRRNMVMAMFLIVVTTYIAMLFLGIDGMFVDYSDNSIWSVPQNLTIVIRPEEDDEVYFNQEFIDKLNADERVDSLQVRYWICGNQTMVRYEDKLYKSGSISYAYDGRYSLFNIAYKKYIMNLDSSITDIIAGSAFDESGECQVLLSNEICQQLDEKCFSQPEKMQDFIGKYIYISDEEGREIPVKIVGIYHYLLKETIRNSIDSGILKDKKSLEGISGYNETEYVKDDRILYDGIKWQDIILNEAYYQAVEGMDSDMANVDSLEIVLKDYNEIAGFCKEIKEDYGYYIDSRVSDLEYQIEFIKKIRVILLALMIFVSAVAVIIIIDSINIILNKKRQNMAMLNAVGIEKKVISRMFRLEFMCVGTLAFLIAGLLSYYSMKLLVELLNHNFAGERFFSAVSMNFFGIDFGLLYIVLIFIINLVIFLPLHNELDKNILERIKG